MLDGLHQGLFSDERMNCLPPIFGMTLMLSSVCCSLPAPINVFIDSHNFHHVLKWDPGPGTPPGTTWYILQRDGTNENQYKNISSTSLQLLFDTHDTSEVTVMAFYNESFSPKSVVTFTSYSDTKIGPAELSLAGCGNCIQVNITMPKPDWTSEVKDMHSFYYPKFIIRWRKAKEEDSHSKVIEIYKRSLTLDKLEMGEEYCLEVDTKIPTNQNTRPSNWTCTFTSLVAGRKDSAALGAITTLLIIIVGVLMISTFCLYYTGLCKLQETLPVGLSVVLSQGYTLTPEKTIPDQIISEEKKTTIQDNLTSHAATRDSNSEEEEEEEDLNDYLDRNASLFLRDCHYSGTNVSKISKLESVNSGSLKERSSAQVEEPPAEFEIGDIQRGLDQGDIKPEDATISFMPEEGQTEVQEHITGKQEDNEKVNACYSSGNVNLFSVTLAMLTASVKEEQNTRDYSNLYESETPLATVSKLTGNNTDPQIDSKKQSDNWIPIASAYPTLKGFTKTGYEGRHAFIEEEEDQEGNDEEEFSGYMSHP